MNKISLIFVTLFSSICGFSQTTIYGTITDQHSDTLYYINVYLISDTTIVNSTQPDSKGIFKFELNENVVQPNIFASYLTFSTDTLEIGANRIFNLSINIPDNLIITIPPHEKYPVQNKKNE